LLAQVSLQEVFCRPSRISMRDLGRKYHLPSAISKYESLHVPDSNGSATAPIGVHYLKYSKKKEIKGGGSIIPLVDAVYVHHGFGASSLSWLPTLPSLVHRLGARVGLGHDMVGFGFTDRRGGLDWYTTDASARISRAVFAKETLHGKSPDSVAVFGHSLGAIGALKMALQLPRETSKFIILCAPALGLMSGRFPEKEEESPSKREHSSGPLRGLRTGVFSFLRKTVAFPLGGYVLRRAVG
jgi:pimeloyl-ACP methyl ester carboxylesterase